jgi:hypothetical protein
VNSPAFGIEKLANGRGVFGVLFKNEDGYLARFFSRIWSAAFHVSIITAG